MPKHEDRIGNWRLDSVGRLVDKYASNSTLNACYESAVATGVPPEDCRPAGSSDPRTPKPQDSFFSEFILRSFECYRDRGGHDNDPYPRAGFKMDLRGIAFNLNMAAMLLADAYHVAEVSQAMIPVEWLRFAAELAWYRSAPGVPNPLAEMDKELRREENRYPYLSALWCAWYPVFVEKQPDVMGWD